MKPTKQQIHNKFNGHCAYCGKPISIDETHVDEYLPVKHGGATDIENLMPVCRMCKQYKRGRTPDQYRELLKGLAGRISKNYHVKIGVAYGMVLIGEFDGIFWLEYKCTSCNINADDCGFKGIPIPGECPSYEK